MKQRNRLSNSRRLLEYNMRATSSRSLTLVTAFSRSPAKDTSYTYVYLQLQNSLPTPQSPITVHHPYRGPTTRRRASATVWRVCGANFRIGASHVTAIERRDFRLRGEVGLSLQTFRVEEAPSSSARRFLLSLPPSCPLALPRRRHHLRCRPSKPARWRRRRHLPVLTRGKLRLSQTSQYGYVHIIMRDASLILSPAIAQVRQVRGPCMYSHLTSFYASRLMLNQ